MLEGTWFDDILRGTNSTNTLFGLEGNDRLSGRDGDDWLVGGRGSDRLQGGGGTDVVSYASAGQGVTADLRNPGTNTGEAKGDTYSSIEALVGTSFDDVLGGTNLPNTLVGDFGKDRLEGRGGTDFLDGGRGGDILDGGDGIDYASYDEADRGLKVDLNNPRVNTGESRGDTFIAIEGLSGSGFNDVLRGDGNDNSLFGREGMMRFSGGRATTGSVAMPGRTGSTGVPASTLPSTRMRRAA